MRRVLYMVLALPLPPLGVWLAQGRGVAFLAVLALFSVAQAVFWFLAAGPGVVLWAATIALAMVLSLFAPKQS